MSVRFRTARADEMPLVLSWAAAEGWNPGPDDAAAFYASDPQGFFVADPGNGPIAAISVVNHSDDFAFLGLYLCLPEHRGKGIGFGLWQHALTHAGARSVGLDGVPAQQDNYRKSGFVLAGQTFRFEGQIPADHGVGLRPASAGDRDRLCQAEARANGYAKPAFMKAWTQDSDSRRTLLHGTSFATIRRCERGAKIGPLVADNLDDARALLMAIAAAYPAGPFIIDVPDDQSGLTSLCREWGMEASFNTARMYRGPAPKPGPGIRSIATLELG
ncbi:GNAT family N-acetyltransferase [Nioella aestuarii]|uniref:GNAT family N-acetyltransferase n=1 Tax=Nioella aestuarii TaxID=1662864 RepID=UPI003D7FD287